MASMNISVPDSMREWVQRRIESGEYASASDYVRDLIHRDQNTQARLHGIAAFLVLCFLYCTSFVGFIQFKHCL